MRRFGKRKLNIFPLTWFSISTASLLLLLLSPSLIQASPCFESFRPQTSHPQAEVSEKSRRWLPALPPIPNSVKSTLDHPAVKLWLPIMPLARSWNDKDRKLYVFVEAPLTSLISSPVGIVLARLATGRNPFDADALRNFFESYGGYALTNTVRNGVNVDPTLTKEQQFRWNYWYSVLIYSAFTAGDKVLKVLNTPAPTGKPWLTLLDNPQFLQTAAFAASTIGYSALWPIYSQKVGTYILTPVFFGQYPSSGQRKDLYGPEAITDTHQLRIKYGDKKFDKLDQRIRDLNPKQEANEKIISEVQKKLRELEFTPEGSNLPIEGGGFLRKIGVPQIDWAKLISILDVANRFFISVGNGFARYVIPGRLTEEHQKRTEELRAELSKVHDEVIDRWTESRGEKGNLESTIRLKLIQMGASARIFGFFQALAMTLKNPDITVLRSGIYDLIFGPASHYEIEELRRLKQKLKTVKDVSLEARQIRADIALTQANLKWVEWFRKQIRDGERAPLRRILGQWVHKVSVSSLVAGFMITTYFLARWYLVGETPDTSSGIMFEMFKSILESLDPSTTVENAKAAWDSSAPAIVEITNEIIQDSK